jgi:hypothetical protein
MPDRGDSANVLLQVPFRFVVVPLALNRCGQLLLLNGAVGLLRRLSAEEATKNVWADLP